MLKTLQKVLDQAHRGHRYIRDFDQYKVAEFWSKSLVGDCEDFALTIREMLEMEGIESDLVHCITETGEGHLVVSVKGWILDNRYKWVMNRSDLNYKWLKVGKPDGRWFEIGGEL